MKNSKVSVILPTYNRAEMLKSCIYSVLNQTYHNLELLVIDDGSIDKTKDVVNNIKDKRIRYYYKKNEGPSQARNYGLKKVEGQYFTFIDDDDEYLPEKISMQVKYLSKRPKYLFCFTNVYIKINGKLHKHHKTPPESNYFSLLFGKNFIPTPSILMRRSILNKVSQFDPSLEIAQDYDFWLNSAKISPKFGYIDKPLVVVKKHATNRSGDFEKLCYYDAIVRLRHLGSTKKNAANLKQKYETEKIFQKGRFYFFQRKYDKSTKYFLTATKLRPRFIKSYGFYVLSLTNSKIVVSVALKIFLVLDSIKFKLG